MLYYQFSVDTSLTPTEVMARVASVTLDSESVANGNKPGAHIEFLAGELRDTTFWVKRYIPLLLLLRPRVRGQVAAQGAGSRLDIRTYPHPAAVLLFVLALVLVALHWAVYGVGSSWPLHILILVVIAIGFISEATHVKKILANLLRVA
jgi:hypothetical protein